jgi:hypothetical protein
MSQQFTLGKEISVRLLRDYVIEHKVNKGDSIVLSALNFEHIVEEIKRSPEGLMVPIKILDVIIAKDNTSTVETGKIQIVKNENLNQ